MWGAVAATGAEIELAPVEDGWGIEFRHRHGGSGRYYMVETNGGGVVIFDVDGDGDEDVFLADGAALPGYGGPAPRSRLYRNDGGRFRDVTAEAGIEPGVYVSGGAAGDVDSDGDLDLYLTAFGRNRLYVNRGDGTFEEAGAAAGVDDPRWSSSAAFADVDSDGDLDLYVANYVDFTLASNKPCGDPARGLRGYCGPDVYEPVADAFYRNRGDGTFEEASAAAGLGRADGAGLAVAFGDLDGDGHPDLYVANDLTPNFLYRNRGDGTFEDLSLLSGTSYGPGGLPEAGMGIALADLGGDGRLDVVVTNYEGETNACYRNLGGLVFSDERFVSGLGEPTLRPLAFGVAAADLDHDGDLDLVFANGHVRDNAQAFSAASRYRQANQVFENLGPRENHGRFRELAGALPRLAASRGLAIGDLDGDGDLDLVVSNVDDRAEVVENRLAAGGWLGVRLERPRGNRFGVGARLEVTAGELEMVREIQAGASYMSQHALPAHFGLGPATAVERLRVRWPGGRRQELRHLPAGRRVVVVEPAMIPPSLKGS